MHNLPNIYKSSSKFNNKNKEYCYLEKVDIAEKIEELLNSRESIIKKRVYIKTKDKEYRSFIMSKNQDSIKLFNDEIVKIGEIEQIKRIS